MKLSHAEWVERKARDLEDEKYEKMLEDRRARLQEQARKNASAKKFDEWLLHKENYERAVQLLGQLDKVRLQSRENWIQVAVSLNAVDCLRGVYKEEAYQGLPCDRDPSHDVSREVLKKRKPLEEEFFRWSKHPEHGYEFENVPIGKDLAKTFSLGAQEIMSEYAEQIDKKGEHIIPNLKYSAPKVKQAKHDKRNLFNPDKVKYNKIFNKLMRAEYRKARAEMYEKLDQLVNSVDSSLPLQVAEKRILTNMGLGRLAKWVEEDETNREELERARKQEDKEYARKVHLGFVKKKEGMKIRLPDAESDEDETDLSPTLIKRKKILFGNSNKENSTSRMDFTTGKKPTAIRPKRSTAAKNSVEILAGSSTKQKYAYCTNKRDLELARSKLAQDGHIFQENFKDEDGDALQDDYLSAKKSKTKRDRIQELVKQREEKAAETYRDWVTQKELRSQAIEALQHIDKPGKSGQGIKVDLAHWRFVGEQLKGVDPTLLGEFTLWSKDFKTPGQCKITWESLPPNVCDTCCPSTSVHKVLLKFLNRPGTDFPSIFDYAVDRQLKKMMASDGRDISDATEEERKTVEDTLQLSPKQFRQMMLDGGIVLQPNEVRVLTTMFDEDGDGKISRKEFLRFVGYDPRPGARGESLKVLRGGKLCTWEACCHITGMVNAYDVMPIDDEDQNKNEDDDYGYTSFEDDDNNNKNVKQLPINRNRPLLLRSGKVKKGWTRVPLPDYEKRVKKLLKYGDRVSEDFSSSPPKSCQLSKWTNEERSKSLEGLLQLAKKNKEITKALEIQNQGEPPLAPIMTLGPIDSLPENQRQTCLVLQWKPQEGSMFPSFYVLECAGKEGGRSHRQHEYKELFRDPPSAASEQDQLGKFVVTNLEPGVRYYFRLRAFNGYGSSPYTYNSFATAPEAPPIPIIKSVNPTTLTLSWGGFESGIQTRLREIRDIFRGLDYESSGVVDRDEFVDVIEKTNPSLLHALENTPSPHIPGSSILDMIEDTSNGDSLSWKDIKSWMAESATVIGESDNNTISSKVGKRLFQYVLCKCVSDEEVDHEAEGRIDGTNRQPNDVVCSILKASEWYISRATTTGGGQDQGEDDLSAANRFELPKMELVELPEPSMSAKEKPSLKVILRKQKMKSRKKGNSNYGNNTTFVGSLDEPVVHLEVYEQVYVGSDTSCTLTGLNPGESYQFRVFIVNRSPNGMLLTNDTDDSHQLELIRPVASRLGPPLVVNMPAVAPQPPKIGKTITTDSVTLVWGRPDLEQLKQKSKAKESRNAKKDDWTKVVGDWAKDPSMEQTGGVGDSTIRKMFMRYDKDGNGIIDSEELVELFIDLGIRTTGTSFEDAKNSLDRNRDGKITFSEFSKWWSKENMKFLLLHDVIESEQDATMLKKKKRNWKVVYRGDNQEARVTGLTPNMKHVFALQCEMNLNLSAPSNPVFVYTAPETPQQPVIIEAGPKHFRVKWYAGFGGADRYVLESLLIERLSDDGKPKRTTATKKNDWQKVYEGKDTLALVSGLETNSVYRLRVKAVNKEMISSKPSLPVQYATSTGKRNLEKIQSKSNAASYYEIECTGNVVTGDTILFTERVFAKENKSDQVKSSKRHSTNNFVSSLSQQSIMSDKNFHTTSMDSKRRTSSSSKAIFISERTVAGRVVNSVDTKIPRLLTIEVMWSSLSVKSAPTTYNLHTGARITRSENDLFKFETFRARWAQEDARWSRDEEKDAMN